MRRKESFLCCCRRQGKTTTHFFLSPSFSLVEGTHKQNSLFVERYARLPDGVVARTGRDGLGSGHEKFPTLVRTPRPDMESADRTHECATN